MQAATITPGTYDAPDVQVTISRSANANGGQIPLQLGRLLGVPGASGSATAVAVVTSPGAIGAGGVFPIAVDQCVYSLFWNFATNLPPLSGGALFPAPSRARTKTIGEDDSVPKRLSWTGPLSARQIADFHVPHGTFCPRSLIWKHDAGAIVRAGILS
ncbi:TadG family pilus assembly protein [Burkholderia ambifaria]|uniref:TadG family pilus assembly protein n=1 Tax=Burkholderia ambifaria TaxID=152480 RepID=UPI00067FD85F|nr:TadG family pilus assembly protein [Burkholderia ambifaria]